MVRKLFGFNDAVDKLMNEAIEEMKRQGATIVDPADIATLDQLGDVRRPSAPVRTQG